jgi:hypothetical protein
MFSQWAISWPLMAVIPAVLNTGLAQPQKRCTTQIPALEAINAGRIGDLYEEMSKVVGAVSPTGCLATNDVFRFCWRCIQCQAQFWLYGHGYT